VQERTVGLDLASEEHRLVVVDQGGARLAELVLVATLKPLVAQIRLLTSQIACALRAHDDRPIFLSLFRDPKSTVTTAAELLAEIGDNRSRHPGSASLEAIAGQTPVAVHSGKKKVATFRWACNKNLRAAVGVLADTSRHHNPWAHDIYQRARARGHDHPHALRILGCAWLRVSWRNLNRLLATQG